MLLEINIVKDGGVLAPTDLQELIKKLPQSGGTEGVIVSGRLPVWAYAAVAHYFHPRPWVATFDPRMGKGVVVQSHVPDMKVGDLVEVPDKKTVIEV